MRRYTPRDFSQPDHNFDTKSGTKHKSWYGGLRIDKRQDPMRLISRPLGGPETITTRPTLMEDFNNRAGGGGGGGGGDPTDPPDGDGGSDDDGTLPATPAAFESPVGLVYNGSSTSGIGNLPFYNQSGIYCIVPSYYWRCPEKFPATIKVGMSGGAGSRQLGVRLSNHGTSLVEFTILWIITVDSRTTRERVSTAPRRGTRVRHGTSRYSDSDHMGEGDNYTSSQMAKALESEAFQFLQDAGASRRRHMSGHVSEYFENVDFSMAQQLFKHLTDIDSISSIPGNSYIPQYDRAWLFTDLWDAKGAHTIPKMYERGYALTPENEANRERLQEIRAEARLNGNTALEEWAQLKLDQIPGAHIHTDTDSDDFDIASYDDPVVAGGGGAPSAAAAPPAEPPLVDPIAITAAASAGDLASVHMLAMLGVSREQIVTRAVTRRQSRPRYMTRAAILRFG